MDYRELVNLGLSEKEAKVYLAALGLGKSPVQKIAETAEVNRATTYVIIEGLIKKGLVSSYHEGKKQFFMAEAPEKLTLLFREQELEVRRKQEYLDKILPELKSLNMGDGEKPTVRYYEGKDGLRAMAEEIFLTSQDSEATMIYSYDLLKEVFTDDELASLRSRRQDQRIAVRSILNDEHRILNSDSKRHVIPTDEFPITCDIAFFGDIVRIATLKGKLAGIIVENKEIAQTLKILFNLAWRYLDEKKKGARG